MPKLHEAGDGEDAQHQGKNAHGRLGHEQELALIDMVRHEAGPRKQQELRSVLERHDDPHGGRVVPCELCEYEPVLRRTLHPRPNVGDQRARCPHPIVEDSQRAEDGRQRRAHQCPGELPPWKRPNSRASANGLWNALPIMPLTRWGTALARKAPPKKYDTRVMRSILRKLFE